MRHSRPRRQLTALASFLIVSLSLLPIPLGKIPLMPTIPIVTAVDWATPPTRWINVTGGTGSQSWLFRVGSPPASLSADLLVGEVSNLFMWEFKIQWDAALLNFSSIVEGLFLQSGGGTTFFFEAFEDHVGLDYILANCTLQTGQGVTGSGIVATVNFEVDASVTTGGGTSIDLYETILINSSKNRMSHGQTDGFAMVGDYTYFPLLYVTPQTSVADPDQMFNVTVWIDEVSDLYAWGFVLKWDPFQLLNCMNIDNHVFLEGNTYSIKDIDNLSGEASVATTLTGEQEGTTGSGALATFTFRAMPPYTGKANLRIVDSELAAVDLGPPQRLYAIPHSLIGGSFRTAKPAAVFTFTPEPPTPRAAVDQPILFNATDSSDPGGLKIISYNWDFGDGAKINETSPTIYHSYTRAGSYSVNLTVVNSDGVTATASKPAGSGGPEVVIRDVAVTSVMTSHVVAMHNVYVNISVTVVNNGTDRESFLVQAYAHNQSMSSMLGEYNVTLQRAGDTATRYFIWDTTGHMSGEYTIQGIVPPLLGESHLTNNKINATIEIADYNLVNYPTESLGRWLNVLVESNASLPFPFPFQPTTFKFNYTAKEIRFNITGSTGAFSYCRVAIPKVLLSSEPLSEWIILFDGSNVIERIITENGTHTFMYFNCTMSEHLVQILGTRTGNPPAASFTVSPTSTFYFTNQVLAFNASGSSDADGRITEYFFDYGDGSNATGVPAYDVGGQLINVTWVYIQKGQTPIQLTTQTPMVSHNFTTVDVADFTWEVTLTVWDNDLFSDTTSASLKIFQPYDIAIANITISKSIINITEIASVNVTVVNKFLVQGSLGIHVALYGNSTLLATETKATAPVQTSRVITIQLNTTTMAFGNYRLNATAAVSSYGGLTPPNFPAEDPGKLLDNQRSYGYITIKPYDSQLTLQATPLSLRFGSQVIINGQITPAKTGARVTLESQSGTQAFINITTVTTRLGGQFQHLWVPAQAGTYKLRALWLGDAITSSNVSNTLTITVTQISSTITLDLSSSSVAYGAFVSLSGTVDPTRPNAQVTVYYRRNDGEWITISSTSTDPQSSYSLQWQPPEAGTYDIQARWAGDVNTAAAASETKQLQVQGGGLPIDPIYIIAGISMVIIVILAIYFLKFRKAK